MKRIQNGIYACELPSCRAVVEVRCLELRVIVKPIIQPQPWDLFGGKAIMQFPLSSPRISFFPEDDRRFALRGEFSNTTYEFKLLSRKEK